MSGRDGMDREILRSLSRTGRTLSGRQIAHKVNLSPSAIAPRLNNLRTHGYVKKMFVQKTRVLDRKIGRKIIRVRAPRTIFWGIDLKTKPKVKGLNQIQNKKSPFSSSGGYIPTSQEYNNKKVYIVVMKK